MRKPMLMGGAAIPGWGLNLSDYLIFFQISLSLPENLSGVICLVLFFLGGSFFIDLPPRCHTLWSSPQVEKLFSVASLVTRMGTMLVRKDAIGQFSKRGRLTDKTSNSCWGVKWLLPMMSTGEYLTVMGSGDLMIYTDSDTVPGAGFLKLTKTY